MKMKNHLLVFKQKFKEDYSYKTYILTIISICTTSIFAIYNIYLTIMYKADWNISIAIYYSFLALIRSYIIISDKKLSKQLNLDKKIKLQKKIFLSQSIMLFAIDILLIAPISFLILQKREIHYSQIPAIATAAYTVCKIFFAIKNSKKAKKTCLNFNIVMLRNINLKDSLVAILSLQNILIFTFDSGGVQNNMLIVCAFSSLGIWITLIIISISNLIKTIQINKSK